ncbi:hypothetical protein ACKVMT_05365 [Halobacteriales archaeon Cl-PHB]
MSDPTVYTDLVDDVDGLELTKQLDTDSYEVPAIVYDVVSDRTDDVTVRIVDELPSDMESEHIGLHPLYGDEYWELDGEHLVFEYELAAGEEYRTLYAVRTESHYDAAELFESPNTVDVVPGVTTAESPTSTGGFTRSAGADATDADEDAALTNDDRDSPTDDPSIDGHDGDLALEIDEEETADGDDAGPSVAEDSLWADTDIVVPDPNDREAVSTNGSLVDTLAKELEAGAPADESLAVLKTELGGDAAPGSLAARVDRLQTDMADLRAYTGALEDFLDENGSGQEILADHENHLESIDDRLSAVESTVTTVEDDLETVESEIDEVTTAVDELAVELTDLEVLAEDLADVRALVHDVDDRADAIGATLDEEVSRLAADLDDLEERVPEYDVAERVEEVEADLDDEVAALTADVDDLEEQMPEYDVAERVDEIESTLDDLRDFLDNMKAAFE